MQIARKPWITPSSPNMIALMSDIMNAKVPEILVSGPRNCGKSWIISQCELSLAEMYPGIQILNLRHEMSAMGALLSQWDQDILEHGLDDKRNPFTFHSSTKKEPRTHILCDNGSKILFAGMDRPNKALGTAIDFVYYNEVQLENNPTHWSAVLGAMEGARAGNWPGGKYLAIADMNPTHKFFWAYLRAHPKEEDTVAAMKHYYVRHIDHPLFYVWDKKRWTYKGRDTVDGLDRAYGVGTFDHMRNVLGEFCSAEGMVYTMYKPEIHEVEMSRDDFGVDTEWQMSIDHGGTSPFAIMLTGQNGDKFRTFKELAMSQCTIDEVIEKTDALLKRYRIPKSEIRNMFADTNVPGFNKSLREAKYPVREADKDILAGVSEVKTVIGDNRFHINKNSLEERDPKYDGPQGWKEEVLIYAYLPKADQETAAKPDHPVDNNKDHWCDALRYKLYGLKNEVTLDLPAILGKVKMGGNTKESYV